MYRLNNTYTIKVELDSPIYVWQFEGKHKFTEEIDPIDELIDRGFELLQSEEMINAVLDGINQVQKTSENKLIILYNLARRYATNHMNRIIEKNMILKQSLPIPPHSIATKFDQYFRSNLQ